VKKSLVGMLLFVAGLGLVVIGLYDWRLSQALEHNEKMAGAIAMTEQENQYLRETSKQIVELPPMEFVVVSWEATAYAPLDPKAVEGVCYSGDPNRTASGTLIQPGVSIATGPSIPFGSWVWIKDLGWRRVDDRGGKIKDGKVDICMVTQDEARKFGRKKVLVVIPIWSE